MRHTLRIQSLVWMFGRRHHETGRILGDQTCPHSDRPDVAAIFIWIRSEVLK